MSLAALAVNLVNKYDLDKSLLEEYPIEVREALLESNKYLKLGVAMQLTRGDWSDGCYRVQDALKDFASEPYQDIDDLIIKEIGYLCECWSDNADGRIFRDCDLNYNKLFEVSKSLIGHSELYYDYLELDSLLNAY